MTRFTALLAAAVVATACSGGSDDGGTDGPDGGAGEGGATGEVTTISFLSPVPPSFFFYPAFVGEELGFFADEGIELEYETIGESVSMTSLLVNGQADVAGPGAAEVFQGLNADQDFDLIYDDYTRGVEGIVVLEDSEIESLEELEGRTIGLAADEQRSLLNFSLDSVGLSEDDVETANVGTSPATIASSLESGDIDVYVGSVLDFAGLQAAGVALRNITPEDVGSIPGTSFAVTPETKESMGDALPRFLRAWSKALHVGQQNPDLVEAIMREASPEEWEDEEVGRATMELAIELQEQGPEDYGSLDTEAWELAAEQALISGDIDQEIGVSTFLDDQYIEAANDWDRDEVDAIAEEWMDENA